MSSNTQRFFIRDLSWLKFNYRVLQEAADQSNPLYERIKFLAIFSSNLDEFFKVRVSDIRQIKDIEKPLRKRLITKPNKLLREIKAEVNSQQNIFGKIYREQIIPELKENNIHLLAHKKFTDNQCKFSQDFFNALTNWDKEPLDGNKNLFIENESLYLVGKLTTGQLKWVKIDTSKGRFIQLPQEGEQHFITFIDDIYHHNLDLKFGTPFYAIKVSRDAELYIDDEYSGDLLEKIAAALPSRGTGQITRLLIDASIPKQLLQEVNLALDVTETDVIYGGTYHNYKDFFGFPNPTNNTSLSLDEVIPKDLKELGDYQSLFDALKEKDWLLSYPYQSFQPVIRLLKEAAVDPLVEEIKITLYRVSKKSAIAEALLNAVKNGKKVYAFIETKARFDEANNIKWGEVLKEAGATVQFSYPGIKVHTKVLYIKRKEGENSIGYSYISTGNFNEKTATIYSDHGLFTANKKIAKELSQVFSLLNRDIIVPKTKRLLVSPFTARSTFEKLIRNESEIAKNGGNAYIKAKMNSLEDRGIIKLLYKASNAGVNIRLQVRGICCLVPNVEGQSENIFITSVVDRFLEHGRIYIFGNGGKEKIYMGSADWMTRNLDHRIEVITPILDEEIKDQINSILEIQLNDSVKARVIDKDHSNNYVDKSESLSAISSQTKLVSYFK